MPDSAARCTRRTCSTRRTNHRSHTQSRGPSPRGAPTCAAARASRRTPCGMRGRACSRLHCHKCRMPCSGQRRACRTRRRLSGCAGNRRPAALRTNRWCQSQAPHHQEDPPQLRPRPHVPVRSRFEHARWHEGQRCQRKAGALRTWQCASQGRRAPMPDSAARCTRRTCSTRRTNHRSHTQSRGPSPRGAPTCAAARASRRTPCGMRGRACSRLHCHKCRMPCSGQRRACRTRRRLSGCAGNRRPAALRTNRWCQRCPFHRLARKAVKEPHARSLLRPSLEGCRLATAPCRCLRHPLPMPCPTEGRWRW